MRIQTLKVVIVIAAVAFSSRINAQKSKLDKVTDAEIKMTVYAKDSAAPAVYLNKYRETYFDYEDRKGWLIVNEITERIKILNKDGLDYATKRIASYKREKDQERVEDISGKTYNSVKGELVEVDLDESAVFEREVSDRFDETAFTMPNAQVGSIVEWSYKTVSPFWKVDDLVFQEDIPVVDYYAKIRTPGPFTFRRVKRGYFEIEPKEKVEKRSLSVIYSPEDGFGGRMMSTESARISFSEVIAEFQKRDIPALKEEPFVFNHRGYRMSVIYELVSTEFNKGNKKEYATTWPEVAKSIFKDSRFGDRLKRTRFLNDIRDNVRSKGLNEDEKIDYILAHIKSKMAWNGKYTKYAEDELKDAYKRGSGSVAEINLTLIALLKECGLNARPVLVSTKEYGIPLFPTREGYNYVIAGLLKKDGLILLDATDKLSAPNLLPNRVYNWTGRMINEQGVSQEIDLTSTITPSSTIFFQAELTEAGKIEGTINQRLISLEALDLRHKYDPSEKSDWQERERKKYGLTEIQDYNLEGIENLKEPVIKSFSFVLDQAVDQVGDKMFLSPLSFLRLSKNPFKSDERQFPIFFDYPTSQNITVNMKLPEGYIVKALPKGISMRLPDDAGTFLYTIAENTGALQVVMRFTIKKSIIPADFYESLKEFFKIRVEKENEKIILEKAI